MRGKAIRGDTKIMFRVRKQYPILSSRSETQKLGKKEEQDFWLKIGRFVERTNSRTGHFELISSVGPLESSWMLGSKNNNLA